MDGFSGFGLSGHDIYEQVTGGPGTGSLDAGWDAAQLEAGLEESRADEIHQLADEVRGGWQGAAADGAVGVAGPMADTARNRLSQLRKASLLLESQSQMFNVTKNTVVPVPAEPPKSNFLNDLTPWETDLDKQIKQYQTNVQHNFDTYSRFDEHSLNNEQQLPRDYRSNTEWAGDVSVRQPGSAPGGPNPGHGPGIGGPNPGGGPSSPLPVGTAQPPQGTPVQSAPQPGDTTPPGTRGPAGGSVPPPGQSPSGPLPPVGGRPVGNVPPDERGTVPPGGRGGPGAGEPGERGGAGLAEGEPGGRGAGSEGGRGSGGEGGRGSGGGPGARGGAPGEPGAGSRTGGGTGGPAGEEAAARRGALGAAGGRGAGGANGYGPMGVGRGRGDDDYEHTRKYLIGPDPEATFGTDESTAPPVIGEEADGE